MLKLVQPDYIMVELCLKRVSKMMADEENGKSNSQTGGTDPSGPWGDADFPNAMMKVLKDIIKGVSGGNPSSKGQSFGSGMPDVSSFLDEFLKNGMRQFYNIFRQFGLIPGQEFEV